LVVGVFALIQPHRLRKVGAHFSASSFPTCTIQRILSDYDHRIPQYATAVIINFNVANGMIAEPMQPAHLTSLPITFWWVLRLRIHKFFTINSQIRLCFLFVGVMASINTFYQIQMERNLDSGESCHDPLHAERQSTKQTQVFFCPGIRNRLRLEYIAMDKIYAKILQMDRFREGVVRCYESKHPLRQRSIHPLRHRNSSLLLALSSCVILFVGRHAFTHPIRKSWVPEKDNT